MWWVEAWKPIDTFDDLFIRPQGEAASLRLRLEQAERQGRLAVQEAVAETEARVTVERAKLAAEVSQLHERLAGLQVCWGSRGIFSLDLLSPRV